MKKNENLKKSLWFLLKLLIAGGLVGWLIIRNPQQLLAGFRAFNYWYLTPALAAYFLHMIVCSWRWRELTRLLKVKLSGFEALSLTMQGYFFSLVIPAGAIGGDVIKMGVLAKRSDSGTKMEGAFTILMDRIVGMIALFVLALLLLAPATPMLLKVQLPGLKLPPELHWCGIAAIALLCLAGLGASCVIFCHRFIEKIPPFGFLMQKADCCTHGMVTRLISATDVYKKSWLKVAGLVTVSIFLVHLMTVVPFFCILCGTGVKFSCFNLIVAVTLGNIIGLLPFFPGGVGGRDVATILILVAGGISDADARTGQLMYTAIIVFFDLCGGLFFLFDPGRAETRKILQESSEK